MLGSWRSLTKGHHLCAYTVSESLYSSWGRSARSSQAPFKPRQGRSEGSEVILSGIGSHKWQSYLCSNWPGLVGLVRSTVFHFEQVWTSPRPCPWVADCGSDLVWYCMCQVPSSLWGCWELFFAALSEIACSASGNWNGGLVSERRPNSLLGRWLGPFTFTTFKCTC